MYPIAMFIGLILLAGSVFYVASPLRTPAPAKKSAGRGIVPKDTGKLSSEKQRQAILLAIRDLDFDYQAGKVAEGDYQTLRVSLVNEAAQLMQRQEREQADSIEALIQSRRQTRTPVSPAVKAQTTGSAKQLCHTCQAPLPAGAKFCARCGTPVSEATCPQCKQPLHTGDRFCPACGTTIAS